MSTSRTANLLVELFVEELPPKALKKLGESFATVLADSLKAQATWRALWRPPTSTAEPAWAFPWRRRTGPTK